MISFELLIIVTRDIVWNSTLQVRFKRMSQEKKELEKIDVLYFNFKGSGVFLGCVGTKYQIQQIHAYQYFQKDRQDNIYLIDFIKRALANDIFCYISGSTFKGKLQAFVLNNMIKKSGKKIDEPQWLEALLLVSPKSISNILNVSHEEVKEMQRDSIWLSKFDYDREWI